VKELSFEPLRGRVDLEVDALGPAGHRSGRNLAARRSGRRVGGSAQYVREAIRCGKDRGAVRRANSDRASRNRS